VIGFIGGGQMARALAAGFVAKKQCRGDEIAFINPGDANAQRFLAAVPGSRRLADAPALIRESDQVWLAVKPQLLAPVLRPLAGSFRSAQVLVSVAAGIRLDSLLEWSGHAAVIRISPSTPCLVGQGISVFTASDQVPAAAKDRVAALLASVGTVREVPERLIDPISGLSSCGPAFVMTILEALADGAVRAGVPRTLAQELAAELLSGSVAWLQGSGLHPAQLRDQVASPAGSTIEGLAALEEGGLRASLIQAVCASARRAAELGQFPTS